MVNSNVDWGLHGKRVVAPRAEKQPDRLVLSADDNDDKNIRSAITVEITAPNVPTQTIQVKQLGWGKAILLSESKATVSASGGKGEGRRHHQHRGGGIGRARLQLDIRDRGRHLAVRLTP